jgi:UDP-N-acetylmuramoylalanine-D-glutamate ligase
VKECFVKEDIDTVEGRNGKDSISPFFTAKLTVKSPGIIPNTPTVKAFEASSPLEKDVVAK